MDIIIPRREICNVLRGTRSKLNSPKLKAARAALADIYAATQNRQLTEAEDAAALITPRGPRILHAEED